jgi:hypothetical protein
MGLWLTRPGVSYAADLQGYNRIFGKDPCKIPEMAIVGHLVVIGLPLDINCRVM